MAFFDDPKVVDRCIKDKDDKDGEKSGFIEKVKDFIHKIGEKIEETIGFGSQVLMLQGFTFLQLI